MVVEVVAQCSRANARSEEQLWRAQGVGPYRYRLRRHGFALAGRQVFDFRARNAVALHDQTAADSLGAQLEGIAAGVRLLSQRAKYHVRASPIETSILLHLHGKGHRPYLQMLRQHRVIYLAQSLLDCKAL